MSLHISDKELKKVMKRSGYKGCKNCKRQIAPLRSCEWMERGGDGKVHFLCPMWEKREAEK